MRIRKKIDFSQVFLYLTCGVAAFFLFQIGDQGEPFSLALAYGMASAGLSPIISALIFLFSSCLLDCLPSHLEDVFSFACQ